MRGTGAPHRLRPGFQAGIVLGFLSAGLVLLVLTSVVTCSRDGGNSGDKAAADSGESGNAAGTSGAGTSGDPGAAGTPEAKAAEAKAKEVEDLVIARVGKRKITPKDLATKIKVQYPQMTDMQGIADVRQKWEVLKAMVDQYCWVEIGERRGFDKDEEFRATLELSRKFILSNHTVAKLVYDKAKPTAAEVQAYYEENTDQFQTVARSEISTIILPTREQALQVRSRALAGEDFGTLAAQYTTDPLTQQINGSMGTVTLKSLLRPYGEQPDLNARLMEMPAGQVSEPMKTSLGWSLFLVTSHSPDGVQPLAEVEDAIRRRLETKKANELFAQTLEEVKNEAEANIDADAWLQYTFTILNEDEVFQLAQGEKKPQEKIRLYTGLAEKYPEGQRAAQALFMIGFTYADELGDFPKARTAFQTMLEKYPGTELAASATWMLENMEKDLNNLPYAQEIKRKAISG